MGLLISFLSLIVVVLLISFYGVALVTVCTLFGVYDRKQDTDFRAIKWIWAFIIVTFVFYWLGKPVYRLIMLNI